MHKKRITFLKMKQIESLLKSNTLKFILKLAISILLLFFIFRFVGASKLYNELLKANLYYIAAAVSFVVLQIIFKAIRWNAIINIFNKSINLPSSIVYTCISLAFAFVTPARLGELVKVKYLVDKTKLGYPKSLMTVVIEKIFDVIASVLFILIGFSFLREVRFYAAYAILGLILYTMLLILILAYLHKIPLLINKILPKKYKSNIKNLSITRKFYIKSLLLSILLWLILCIQAFFILKALNVPQISFYAVAAVVPLMALSSMLPISIGGIGVREIVAISFFSLIGAPAEKSAVFSLMFTFATFGVISVIGAILYVKEKSFTAK